MSNKAVLMSIRPEWCKKILDGEKTVEVRRTCPVHGTPFKVYIYCTLAGSDSLFMDVLNRDVTAWNRGGWPEKKGRVIGEFTCDKIDKLVHVGTMMDINILTLDGWYKSAGELLQAACLTEAAAKKYLQGRNGCGWHISDLKVYDNPKPLSDFSKHGFSSLFGTNVCGNEGCKYYEPSGDRMVPPTCGLNGHCILHRAPQSWCYVEELKDETILPVLLQRLSER